MPSPPPTTLLRDRPIEVQLGVLEERVNNVGAGVDRNHDTTTAGIAGLGEKLEKLGTDLVAKIDTKLEKVEASLRATYATKEEVDSLSAKVKGIQANLGWGVKAVIGAVITALLGLLAAKAGVHMP